MLRPSLTLFDIFGPGLAYAPRADDRAADWLPPADILDLSTGGQLAVAGDMPVVCSAGFTTQAAADLLGHAGLEMARRTFPFMTGESRAVAERLDPSLRLVFQHALPPDDPLIQRSWIDQDLLAFLNNKANLVELAPAGHVPERFVANAVEFLESGDHPLPFVIKAATSQSTGAGCAVQLCHTAGDVGKAAARFASADRIVIEEMLEIVSAPCLNFVVECAGTVRYLGHADQIISPEGRHLGNWFERSSALPSPAVDIARDVVSKAAGMGYRGIAGIDLALTGDGRWLVLDLNFRTNASTAPLLLAPAIVAQLGHDHLLSRRFEGGGGTSQFVRAMGPFVRRGQFVPLALFDPIAAGLAGAPPSVLGLVGGASRERTQELSDAIRNSLLDS